MEHPISGISGVALAVGISGTMKAFVSLTHEDPQFTGLPQAVGLIPMTDTAPAGVNTWECRFDTGNDGALLSLSRDGQDVVTDMQVDDSWLRAFARYGYCYVVNLPTVTSPLAEDSTQSISLFHGLAQRQGSWAAAHLPPGPSSVVPVTEFQLFDTAGPTRPASPRAQAAPEPDRFLTRLRRIFGR
ncbi:hypothetical protein ACFRR6_02160 [Streptomyces sp. NPDC056891]|uniref:hypothetical protein n=1 Tax=Streptomyces sp. NPDC056891 TaxID=3345961 RepID=UPI003686019B